MDSIFTYKSFRHFDLTFELNFILVHVEIQFSKNYLLKRLFFNSVLLEALLEIS
jgi:hypothetical protein